ncbi:MAG: methyltransferase [Bacteroidetes bacterium]|mgnify:CR=1 FL=1|jgi:tRNA1Val (adenine37-N6)-methyltransferase|nr:methyltransferase [Bacteroidota bacterium]MBT6686848.1 methyltransferase [Bacteroidota bacterium]MBT7144177.1 methyltransferase [Bacteroidota bacterium]MBT7491896.1 methyltransferase [Bacteroidota bacterium]
MPKNYFKFKQFIINQENSSMKVGTDGVLLGAWTKTNNAKNILDIGTGTALIALMLAQKSDAEIVAIEIDKNSYLQSLSNINESRWANRISAKHISLQNFVAQTQRKFDLIVCNPPYFENSLKSPISERNIARHNQNLSTEELLNGVSKLLTENGRFCVVFPFIQANNLIMKAQEFELFCNEKLHVKPRYNIETKRVLMEFSRKKSKINENFIVIENDKRHDYTLDYKNLTKDYYLKF